MNAIQKQLITCILKPHLYENIIFIINNYSRNLYYYALVHEHREVFFGIDEMFQACSIEDVVKYIVYSYENKEDLFIHYDYDIRFLSLKNRFIEKLTIEQKKDFDNFDFPIYDEENEQILLLAQELYGKNPKLFLKDMRAMQEEEDTNGVYLVEYNDLIRCIMKELSCYDYECINIYTNHKTIVNFKNYNIETDNLKEEINNNIV